MHEGTGTVSTNHIVSNLKPSVGTGQDMIALANGETKKQYAKIVMSNTSPYSVVSETMMVDYNTYTGKNRQLRGLHVSSSTVILAAFFDSTITNNGVFEIGTIDFTNS